MRGRASVRCGRKGGGEKEKLPAYGGAMAPRVGPEKEGGKNGIRVQGEEAGRRVFCSCEDDGRPSIGIGRPGAVGS